MNYKVQKYLEMLKSCKKESREPVKRRQVGNELQLIRLLRKKSLIFDGRVHYASLRHSDI